MVTPIIDEETILIKFQRGNSRPKLTIKELVAERNFCKGDHFDFRCSVCQEISINVISKCKHCENLFCKHGCDVWSKRSNIAACPTCNSTPIKTTSLNKYEETCLKNLRFNCHKCNKKFTYAENQAHMQSCQTKKLACPMNCGFCLATKLELVCSAL